jgi:ABC-type transporter Mla subunit MlaD
VHTGIDLQVQNRIVEDLERNAQAQILALNAALEDRGRAIAGFEHRLARTVSELTEVTAALSSKERQLNEIRHHLDEVTAALSNKERQLNEIRHHLDEVTAALSNKERQLLDVYNSASWRVTLPFRLVLGWILSFKK